MNRWVRLACCFYPAAWRGRYAMEFDAMLDQVDANWRDVFDIFKGALTMQFTSWNFKTILLTFGVVGVAIAAAAAFRIPNQYQSMTVMRLTPQNPAQGNGQMIQRLKELEVEVLSRTSLEATIIGLDLYKSQRNDKPLEEIAQNMRNHDIVIRAVAPVAGRQDGATAFSIGYVYPDAKLAQAVNRELVAKFIDQNVTVARRGGIPAAETLEVLDPPSDPVQPIYPKRAAFVVSGLFGGLLAGLTVACALRWRIAIVRRSAP